MKTLVQLTAFALLGLASSAHAGGLDASAKSAPAAGAKKALMRVVLTPTKAMPTKSVIMGERGAKSVIMGETNPSKGIVLVPKKKLTPSAE